MTKYIILLILSIYVFFDVPAMANADTLKIISVRGCVDNPPYEFIDEDGNLAGFNVDLCKELMNMIGVSYEMKLDNFRKITEEIQEKKIDVIMGITYSESWSKKMYFSIPHNYIYYGVVHRNDFIYTSIEDLNNIDIIVQDGKYSAQIVESLGLSDNMIYVQNIADGLALISNGEYDAMVCNHIIAYNIMERMNISNLGIDLIYELDPQKYCIACNMDDEVLLNKLNNALQILKSNGYYDNLYNKWLHLYEDNIVPKDFYYILLFALIVIIVAILFIIMLRIRVRDATKKIRYQRDKIKLLYNEQATVLQELPIGVALFNKGGQLIYVNDVTVQILHFSDVRDILSKRICIYDDSSISEEIKNDMKKGRIINAILKYDLAGNKNISSKLGDTTVYLEFKSFPFKNKGGDVERFVVLLNDITEQRTKELKLQSSYKELRIAKEKAELSDKLKSAFLANVSHEIRTPLNAIVGFSDLLCNTEDIEEKGEYRNIININSELLLNLIGNILDLSKIESGYVELQKIRFDLSEHIRNIAISFEQRFVNPDVKFYCHNPYDSYFIRTDKNRLTQVVTNFINNAFKFTYIGSITLEYYEEDNGVVIRVVDTGIGISEDKQEKIFERFYKVDDFSQGTGLGMAISKAIMEACGGKIGVESKLGQGSTFWAWFPKE